MQPKEKGIVYDFAKLCLNIRTSEDLATREMFLFTMKSTCSHGFVHRPGKCHAGGAKSRCFFFFLRGPSASKWYPKIPKQVPIIENTQNQTSLKDFQDFLVLNEILGYFRCSGALLDAQRLCRDLAHDGPPETSPGHGEVMQSEWG